MIENSHASDATLQSQDKQNDSTAAITKNALRESPAILSSSKQTDPVLAGLRPEDIARARLLARQNYQNSWQVICQRSRFVRQRLLNTLTRMNAPLSLQVIPAVESTYNPYAISHSGALGLWQLMPRTAHGLGIRSNKKINGRRSINASTEAAVSYLIQLHQHFNSWPLAFAAYNMGPYNVDKRLSKQPWTASDGIDAMPVPSQIRLYVQHIIGLVALAQESAFTFPEPVKTRALELSTPVDIHRLAKLSGLSENDIFRFNPRLNQAQYLRKTITIHVPESQYQRVTNKMLLAGPLYILQTVQKGDSLWRIAHNHHISVAMLKNMNHGSAKTLHPGQLLKVPVGNMVNASAHSNPLLSKRRIRYLVRSGDSLWRIAKRFGTTPDMIARHNRLSRKSIIKIGDTLWVQTHIRPS